MTPLYAREIPAGYLPRPGWQYVLPQRSCKNLADYLQAARKRELDGDGLLDTERWRELHEDVPKGAAAIHRQRMVDEVEALPVDEDLLNRHPEEEVRTQ